MQQHGGVARKRERSAANNALSSGYVRCAGRGGAGGVLGGENEGEVIEKEMKRLRLAQGERSYQGRRWPGGADDDDVDMDGGGGAESHPSSLLFVASPRIDYRPINLTLRECHYLRQLRKFQSERVVHLERRAPTDAAAAAVMHAMQGRRR